MKLIKNLLLYIEGRLYLFYVTFIQRSNGAKKEADNADS